MLIIMLKDENSYIREAARGELVKAGKPALEPLIKALEYESELIRLNAAIVLGEIGDAKAAEALKKALNDKSEGVRNYAKDALDFMEAEEFNRKVHEIRNQAIANLKKYGKPINDEEIVNEAWRIASRYYLHNKQSSLAERVHRYFWKEERRYIHKRNP